MDCLLDQMKYPGRDEREAAEGRRLLPGDMPSGAEVCFLDFDPVDVIPPAKGAGLTDRFADGFCPSAGA